MNLNQKIKMGELRYRKPVSVIRYCLMELNIEPETDIRIYPIYPSGWYGTVGATIEGDPFVYIFTSKWGEVTLEIKSCRGFNKNLSLRY